MFGVMLQKVWQKRWMNLSLLLGCILLVATTVSFPLYQKAAYDRMLQDEFKQYVTEEGKWPMVIHMKATCTKDKKDTIGKMERYLTKIEKGMGIPTKQDILYYSLFDATVSSDMNRDDAADLSLALDAMTELEDHASLINGAFYSEDGVDENGAIEVIISQSTMISSGLLLGETLTFDKLSDIDGNPIKIKIVGVFTTNTENTYYFQENPERMFTSCFMNPSLFKEMFTGENASRYVIDISFYKLLDYKSVNADQVEQINQYTHYMCEESAYRSVVKDPSYKALLETYALKKARISATLLILEIPVLLLVAAFLFMISGQMYEMERNEISVIKSRGSSRFQIMLLYLYQGIFLAGTGAVFGIPLGGLVSRVLGSTRNFLEFDFSEQLHITYNKTAFLYALVAVGIALFSISLPALKHSKVSIVNLKQSKSVKKKRLWQILFIDIIFIAISLYGYYSFHKTSKDISLAVLAGDSLDPLLYISSSLFILGSGLFFLRIQPFLIKLIFMAAGKICGPSGYISFMENMKNSKKMQMIMLFMIMTISLGMFHATVARTILENAVDNTEYLDSADVIIKENWPQIMDEGGIPTGQYFEPDATKYASMDFAKSYTKVFYDESAYIKQKKNDQTSVTFAGIHTKEFGMMTSLSNDLNDRSYYEMLNELAVVEDGVLLSDNFATKMDLKVGDPITIYCGDRSNVTLRVVGFFSYFPTYTPTQSVINADGSVENADRFMAVAHYAYLRKTLGTKPYEIWISLHDDATSEQVVSFIDENDMKISKYVNKQDDIESTMTDPLLQGTNGVLTMGFVVTLVLCAVGYLIYWIMSIKERELVFGVLRAWGFHKHELINMLVIEQIFSGLYSVLAGVCVGKLTSVLFVPLLQTSYATADQVLPMRLITQASDLYKLYGIIAGVMCISIVVLIVLLFRMNVTKALKLGEE